MSEVSLSDDSVSHKSRESNKYPETVRSSGRRTSTISTRSQRRSPSPTGGSSTPLTPDESPNPKTNKKRNVSSIEEQDKEIATSSTTPAHSRGGSGDRGIHFCICQRDPKIPRPRNAFILYRQHHQANIVAQNPRLANPEISKIIGEQWQRQNPEVKLQWKALADEEKLRHQQQYPTYRYQPKRTGRRASLSEPPGSAVSETANCPKCAGRTVIHLDPPHPNTPGVPPTPGMGVITPLSRTLPVLSNLSLQSSVVRRDGRPYQQQQQQQQHHHMSPVRYIPDDRDVVGPLSPDNKRRRYNEQPPQHQMPPRYVPAPHPGGAVGPGTPFPFPQQSQPQQHPYPPAVSNAQRDNLPGIRGVSSPPGPMAPPPRPKMGYQQHRLVQGHAPHDRSLTLPPLQTSHATTKVAPSMPTAGIDKPVEEQIMSISFRYKIKTLGQIAPALPTKNNPPRGPLIAIEGDDAEAVKELSAWLSNEFNKDNDLAAETIDGPNTAVRDPSTKAMIEYHNLMSEWLVKTDEIVSAMMKKPIASPNDCDMSGTTPTSGQSAVREKIGENYNDDNPASPQMSNHDNNKSPVTAIKQNKSSASTPVVLIPNFSLHASNAYACRIPITAHDAYAPSDHWQWTATQWRGVVGPDLTIFVRDSTAQGHGDESAGGPRKPAVDMVERNLFVVRRHVELIEEGPLEGSALRRLGFEVSEWVRAFGQRGGS